MEDQRQMNASASTSTTCITCLPREILAKILTGLPAKSAVRFRCCSKFFYSDIPEPRFAFRILFLLRSRTRPLLISLNSVSYSEESHGRFQADDDDSAQVLDLGGSEWSACSSCVAGKMCLISKTLGGEALFDIRTGRCISLPSGLIDDNDNVLRPRFFSYEVLGFDSVSKSHKIFKSAVYTDLCRVWNRLWVLTVGVDKSWREIESPITGNADIALHIHGIIYLIPPLIMRRTKSSKIVAMDVATEKFIKFIPFPPTHEYQPEQWMRDRLRGWVPWKNLNGRLAFINIIIIPAKEDQENKIEIWRLGRSMEEWEKITTLLLPLEESEMIRQATFMGCTTKRMGEIVFLLQSNPTSRSILIYSFEKEVWRRFEIPKVCNNDSFYHSSMISVVHAD